MGLPPLTHESLTAAPGRSRVAPRASVRTGGMLVAGTVAAGAVLFPLYDRLSATAPITADSANAVLQGRAMAGGNVLLSGWTLSGASFYASDLPLYAAFAAIRGLSPAVAHDVGAAIYTLLVIAACLLARGHAQGTRALGRMAVALVLLVSPAPGTAVQLLLLGPFHAGTTVMLLVALLVLDAAGERVWGAAVLGVLLALAVLSDALVIYVGVIPVVLVMLLRLSRRRGGRRADLAVLAAAVLSIPASLLLMGAIDQLGGFATVPLQGAFAPIEALPKNVSLTVEGGLLLLGADFFGQPLLSVGTLAILVHLAGLGFVLATCRWVLRDWRRGREPDRVTQVLLVAMAVVVAAYLFSNQAIDLMTSRYLIPFMAFGAVLAGRMGADVLWTGRLRRAAAVVALAYLALLGVSLRTPAAPTPEAQLEAFLESHGLSCGIAAYWQASTVTVQSGGRVRVRAVALGTQPRAYLWEAEGRWYDPSRPGNDARFVLRDTWDPRSADRGAVEAAFGPPVEEYQVGRYDVLVWDRNLLDDISH
jgi:4-amino-4-deoxy-L-arabinose transferase-like glycosyltransferase